MEDLLQHCMRELAFDGDFGCDASRFKQFIRSFYESRRPSIDQKLDDSFYAYMWRLLIQQPSVRVGLVSQGNATEVYVAPPPSKRPQTVKSKKKQVPAEPAPFPALDNNEDSNASGHLDSIPEEEVDSFTNLIERYGATLRVAVDPETCFRAITGSHTRPSKLTPMVYTALQFISRGRETGLSVVDLGKKTGYDQKTCFYLVRQLLALDLVVKLAQGGIGGGNFCVHKYFYTHSPFWQGVRREGEMLLRTDEDRAVTPTSRDSDLQFDEIDSRHLTSSDLIKSRIIRLLKNSENGLHHYHNLLVTIGFTKPLKKDRRFFVIRIRELIKERVIEKVIVPKGRGSSTALCIRLVADPRTAHMDGIVVQPGDEGDDEQDIEPAVQSSADKDGIVISMPCMNVTIHRQMLQLLEQADSKGLTLNNICNQLGMFDKRTLELLLYRLERFPPPRHLTDLTICDFIENEGRERRHRYYTLTGYLAFVRNEKIEDAGRTARYTSIDISAGGGFYPLSDHIFYSDKAALIKYEREYRNKTNPPKESISQKIGRARTEGSKPRNRKSTVDSAPPLSGRPKGKKVAIIEEIEVESADQPAITGVKRKREDEADQDPQRQSRQHKKRRGLARGTRKLDILADIVDHTEIVEAPLLTAHADTTVFQATEVHDVDHMMEMDLQTALVGGLSSNQVSQPALAENATSTFDSISIDFSQHKEAIQAQTPKAVCDPFDTLEETDSEVFSCDPSVDIDTNFSSHNISTSKKRVADDPADNGTLSNEPPLKRPKNGRPKRGHQLINISQLRAENEILRLVEESGGIVNISAKEFLETYTQLLSSMVTAGEPTSMPVGTQPDRRTIRKITDNLLEHGRLKSLTVTIIPRVNKPRLAKLIYAPTIPQDQLDIFITALRENVRILNVPIHRKLDEYVDFTRYGGRSIFLEQEDNRKKEEQWDYDLMISENDDVVQSRFLSEGQTVAQIYGYILGRVRRARELHQYTLSDLEKLNTSSYIVSQKERIVAFPYYLNDIPVSTYFAIVSVLEHSTELTEIMKTEEGRQMPVRDLPLHLREQLKIGMARARSRLLDLLEILTALSIVTPLQPSETASPYISCDSIGGHPAKFDLAQISEGKGTIGLMTTYWRFNPIAPIYLYFQSSSWPPPFYHDMQIRTADESMAFWIALERACLEENNILPMMSSENMTGSCPCSSVVGRTLRRKQSWVSSYELSHNQKQYMQHKWINPTTCYTVLSDADGGRSTIEHICHVISAPFDVVYDFFQVIHMSLQRDAERIRKRDQLTREELGQQQAAEDKGILAKKAADARAQLESDWEKLVQRIYTGSIPYRSTARVRELRTRYIQSRGGMAVQQWETAVREAISGVNAGRRNPVLPPMRPGLRKALRPSASEHPISVSDLIDRYKDKVPPVQAMSRKKRGKKNASTEEDVDVSAPVLEIFPRRQRFQWTAEYDELARDASAIIRARCRTWHRMDWTALDQVFPFVPRNNVRQRIATLRQEAGGESYLRLLEEKWLEIWKEHRGSDKLPDENPSHPSNFDAITHVEFLRKYVDKRALRVGMSKLTVDHATGSLLTDDISDFLSTWIVNEYGQISNNMDFLWSSIGDEHREKTLLGEAFSIKASDPSMLKFIEPFLNSVAESALKMVLTTPDDEYNADDAASFLGKIGNHVVGQASDNLLARGVVSTTPVAHRKMPGRNLRISDLNEEALGGSFHRSIFSEACAIEDALTEDTYILKDWNILATDGEMAALIDLVSEGRIDFDIDLSEPVAYREKLDWNSKKVDDDQIEIALRVRYQPPYSHSNASSSPRSSEHMDVEFNNPMEQHGFDGNTRVPCRRTTNGVITCPSCLETDHATLFAKINPQEQISCAKVLEMLEIAGRCGVNYETLHSASKTITAAARRLSTADNPLCYWLGYNHPVLVSGRHVKDWTVSIPTAPTPKFVFPRRWINIKGERLEDMWNSALRAVVGVLVIRPGISLADLRKRLVSIYDRQEVNDLLSYLIMEDVVVQYAVYENKELHSRLVYEVGGVEEQDIYLSMGTGAWYRVDM